MYPCFKELLLSLSLLLLNCTLPQCFFFSFLLDFESLLENQVLSLHAFEYVLEVVRLLIGILKDVQYRLVQFQTVLQIADVLLRLLLVFRQIFNFGV